MHLIPEFDGLNVEAFIGRIQIAVKRLAIDQHELLFVALSRKNSREKQKAQ